MLAQLHITKRDKNYVNYHGPNIMARVYTVSAIQLELCLPKAISSYLASRHWKKVSSILDKNACEDSNQEEKITMTAQWLHSTCHEQVLQILATRNGFCSESPLSCRNTFYSFVLPYVTSPLDFVLYWQQLNNLQTCWIAYLNGTRPVFSEKQLTYMLSVSTTTTAPSHMLQWWVRVGLALQSVNSVQDQENLDALSDYTRTTVPAVNAHPSSNLLRGNQTMIYNMIEAATALQSNTNIENVSLYLNQASKERFASNECIQHISSAFTGSPVANLEASVLALSTLSVNLRTLKALILHQISCSSPSLPANLAAVYIAELRDQVLHDMESPYTKNLPQKCKTHIQSYISQADDTLSL
jgi:hypothetical protein